MKATSVKIEIKLKNGNVIPVGTKVQVYPTDINNIIMLVTDTNVKVNLSPSSLYKLVGFKKIPSIDVLTRYVNDGIATTPTGKKVEPDGTDSDGFKSWLIYAHVI